MNANSEIRLVNYKVLETNFLLCSEFVFKNQKIDIEPKFSRSVSKIDENIFALILGVEINNERLTLPFSARVKIYAEFNFNSWEDSQNNFAISSTTAILFPYLRTLLSQVTMLGNVPTYTLPVMNINKVFPVDE